MVIFGAGVITGGILARQWGAAPLNRSLRPANTRVSPPVTPGLMRLEFLRRAQRELELTAAQREQVDKILKESQERTRQLMQPVMPDLRAELKQTKDAIREVLTPEQRVRFDDLLKRQQRPHDQRRPTPNRERPAAEAAPTNAP